MMKKVISLGLMIMALYLAPQTSSAQTTKYKCMIQMTNYMGEGAYIVVSLIDPKGNYEKTLRVMGSDKKWYKTLKSWHLYYTKHPSNVSAISGASVTSGDRSVTVLEIDNSKINAGYKIRFESAVEDNKYYEKDLEIPLTTESLEGKAEGTGYIRYVRLTANN